MSTKKIKVMTIVGTRPEIIRLSRVIAVLEQVTDHQLVHTGQNYDYELNGIFFKELGIVTDHRADRWRWRDVGSRCRPHGHRERFRHGHRRQGGIFRWCYAGRHCADCALHRQLDTHCHGFGFPHRSCHGQQYGHGDVDCRQRYRRHFRADDCAHEPCQWSLCCARHIADARSDGDREWRCHGHPRRFPRRLDRRWVFADCALFDNVDPDGFRHHRIDGAGDRFQRHCCLCLEFR